MMPRFKKLCDPTDLEEGTGISNFAPNLSALKTGFSNFAPKHGFHNFVPKLKKRVF